MTRTIYAITPRPTPFTVQESRLCVFCRKGPAMRTRNTGGAILCQECHRAYPHVYPSLR